jgi:hypothetical protein
MYWSTYGKQVIHFLEFMYDENEKWVKERLLRIHIGKSSSTAAGMRRSATNKNFNKIKRKEIDKCAGYLLNLAPHLRYNKYLKKGYPIATGVPELLKVLVVIWSSSQGENGYHRC